MIQKVAGEIDEAPTKSSETDEMSDAEFIRRRTETRQAPKEKSEEGEAAGDKAPPASGTPEEGKGGEASVEDVLSKAKQGNLDDLSSEELDALAKHFNSRAIARFGELTAKRKQAEERAAALEQEMARRLQPANEEVVENNPFATIDKREELQEKAKAIDKVLDSIDEILDNTDGKGAEEVVHTDGEGRYTRAQLKGFRRQLKANREKYLPARLKELERAESFRTLEASLIEKARKELDWMAKEDSEEAKSFKAQMGDPRIERLRKVDPELAAMLPYYVARATDSIYARKLIPVGTTTDKAPKPKPPSSPSTSAAPSERRNAPAKEVEDARKRFAESGSDSDFVALRTKQLQKRFN